MKTAVSIPDALFDEADGLAERMQTSRSDLYARALRLYLASHAPDQVTEAANAAIDSLAEDDHELTEMVAQQGLQRLRQIEW
ncbi:hypothetical protein FJQ54_08530 [Sandaracinobacter neustonicus]|uniref:Ribbon-helix-helix protein, CopG family n=1 Tax=Sandaracinobacter neustonicus TaxID=1715348 RepID=A0A501XL39_9SPHN|nr:hypothetical protein [Sandaracinobacter neustonicus]TPE61382.1 hypothetical protein FJQ54_08530 [Sandaracinobacter neustonicus]